MKTLITFILSCCCFSVLAQNAFYEAQYLSTLSTKDLDNLLGAAAATRAHVVLSDHEKQCVTDYKAFLDKPFASNLSNLDISGLKSAIEKYNKYLTLEVSGSTYTTGFIPAGAVTGLSMISSLIGGNTTISPEQQTKIIDELTKYYAEEFQKAQVLTYMEVFKETIGKIGELEVLFPQTYEKLKKTQPTKFPDLGNEFKTVFNDDLRELLPNLISHIESHTKANLALENRLSLLNETNIKAIKGNAYYNSLKLSAEIAIKLTNNYHPVDLLNYIDTKYNASMLTANSNIDEKLILAFHGLNLIQKNILDTTKIKDDKIGNVWLSLQTLSKLDTETEWTYFMALIYQQDRDFFNKYFFDASSIASSSIVSGLITAANLKLCKERLQNITSALTELEAFRANLKEENLKENYLTYMNLILKVLSKSNDFSFAKLDAGEMKKYLSLANYTFAIYDNARKKDYSNSIYYLQQIIEILQVSIDNNTKTLRLLDKYSTFMIDAINSKTDEEVKNMIRKNVAEPASFILKREYVSTFSITGQPGYFISGEWLNGKDGKGAFASGITLPIGFELTFKAKPGNENSGSFGFFMQLLDLGAVLNFRVSNSESTLPDKIEFKQLFSPGGSFTYGFKNSPLTLALGYQYTSQLRKISDAGGNEYYPSGNRIFLRMAWDIPLINISKSKDK
ncbi:MAG: hypothetical protein V4541_14030 [Bacteroidota bacterium]